jgi:hypothetical protein
MLGEGVSLAITLSAVGFWVIYPFDPVAIQETFNGTI